MTDCLFCRIAHRELPSEIVREDDRAVAFRDVNPQAPTHILVVPKKHIASLSKAAPEDCALLGHLLVVARELAEELDLESGYRIVVNNGAGAGQTVLHIHLHLLGGRPFNWPPG